MAEPDDPWAAVVDFDTAPRIPPSTLPAAGAPVAAAPPDPNDPYAAFDPKPAPTPVYRGTILPITKYSDNSVRFEPLSSGLLGGLISSTKQAATLPKRVYTGETPMPATFDPKAEDPRAPGIISEGVNFASTFGPNINPMVRSGDRAIPGAARVAPDLTLARVPTNKELLKKGGQQLDEVREMPVQYKPQVIGDLANVIEQDLIKKGIFPENSKQLYKTLDRMRAVPKGDADTAIKFEPGNLMALRENVSGLFTKPKESQKGVGIAFDHLNNFIEKPPASAVISGPAGELGGRYAAARGNYAAGKRGEGLEDIRRTADLRSSSANSGQNFDNSLRGRIASLLLNDKKLRGYDAADVARLEAIPEGSFAANLMRNTGNKLGGGGGLGAGVTAGIAGSAAHFLGAGELGTLAVASAAPTIGGALKSAAARSTAGALREAELATRRRSPLFLEQAATQDLIPGAAGRDAMARALLQMGMRPRGGAPPVIELPTINVEEQL
jgi:hypothetical protein